MTHERSPIETWFEGTVDRAVQHFSLSHRPHPDDSSTVWPTFALVGPPLGRAVVVEFLVDRENPMWSEAVDQAIHTINDLLIKGGGPNPWLYALNYCGSFSNAQSDVCWRSHMSRVERKVVDFELALRNFRGFGRRGFRIGDLRANPDWAWGNERGVYCFVIGKEVVYVGRALGCTLGERIADQLSQKSDPEWAKVVEDDDHRVEIFSLDEGDAFLGAALEAYLIQSSDPRPRFNSRVS